MKSKKSWDDVLGMRATQSDDTVLNGAFVPDELIVRKLPTGFKGMDEFVLGIFVWALIGFANVYYGLAQQVLDKVLEKLSKTKSISLERPSMAYHGVIQHDVGEMVMEIEGIGPHLDTVAREWSEGKDYGPAWGIKIIAAKCRSVESSWHVVDKAMDIMGGFGLLRKAGFERLFRDARLGKIHPANGYLSREFLAKAMLGIDMDHQPR